MYEETFVLKRFIVMIVTIVLVRYCVYSYYFRPGVCDPGATFFKTMRKTMHELRNTTIFETSVSYVVCILTIYVFSEFLQEYSLQHDFCSFFQFHPTITSTLQVYCNTSMHLYYENVASINVYIQHATE